MQQVELDRVLTIARELESAGRRDDALLLARLAAEVTEGSSEDFVPAISPEELDRRLEAAEADIAAGRVTPHEVVWQETLARRRAAAERSPAKT